MRNQIIIFIIGFVLGGGSVWLYIQDTTPKDIINLEEEEVNEEQTELPLGENRVSLQSGDVISNRIVVPNQEAGGSVVIQSVSFNQPGWVVVHEILPDGSLGNALGAQRFDAGDYAGVVSLLRVTESGNIYSAVLYGDNGDRRFDLEFDLPELNESQELIKATFSIL